MYLSKALQELGLICFEIVKARVKTYNNMAQAQMKLTAWDSAFASIRQVRSARVCSAVYICRTNLPYGYVIHSFRPDCLMILL